MKNWPMPISLPLDSLLLDAENPRVETQSSQRAAIKALLKSQSDASKISNKIIELAISIAEKGFNTAEPLMVMPHGDKYIVLEGNRRLLAVKILRNPSLATEDISKKNMIRLEAASKAANASSKINIPCVTFDSRGEADPFIQLKHTGENKGVGLVSWNRKEIGRYKERLGHKPLDLQIIDFLKTRADVSAEVKKNLDSVPGTTLIRFAKDKNIRNDLGILIKNDKIDTTDISDTATAILAEAANEFATGLANVNMVRNSTDRANYLKKIKSKISDSKESTKNNIQKNNSKAKLNKPQIKSTKDRTTLIPTDCVLKIPHPRINDIYVEMVKINPYDFPNLAAVVIRVFLELSLDEYITNNVSWRNGTYNSRISLHQKILAVADHMRTNNIMNEDELLPVEKAASNEGWLASKNTMHGFIHNRHLHPVPADIISIWNNLQNLFMKMWP